MWRPDRGAWFDWDLINGKHRDYFFVSNLTPLWTGSYNMSKKAIASAVLGYLKNEHIIEPDYSIRFNGKFIVSTQRRINTEEKYKKKNCDWYFFFFFF